MSQMKNRVLWHICNSIEAWKEIIYVLKNMANMRATSLAIILLLGFPGIRVYASQASSSYAWRFTGANTPGDIYYGSVLLASPGMLQLFAPGYAAGYFSSNDETGTTNKVTRTSNGYLFTKEMSSETGHGTLRATETQEFTGKGRASFRLILSWNGKGDAVLEWNPVLLNVSPFVGSTLATKPGSVQSIPYIRTGHAGMLTLAPAFREVNFRGTAVGEVQLTAAGTLPDLGDGRNDPYLANRNVLWPGLLGITIQPGQVITSTINVTISGSPPSHDSSIKTTGRAKVSPFPEVLAPPRPLGCFIVPQPKIVIWGKLMTLSGVRPRLLLSPNIVHLVHEGRFANINPLIKMLGLSASQAGVLKDTRNVLTVTFRARKYTPKIPNAPQHTEGYALTVHSDGVAARGYDMAGLRWAVASLLQLIQRASRNTITLQDCSISDWPSMKFRGIHLFVGKNALPFHSRLLSRVLAPLKMDRLVLECEYAAWKGHPELLTSYSMPLHDLHREVELAKNLGVTPIPLIETLGHSQWLFNKQHNLELAEDPRRAYAYDATNPRVYKVVFNVFGQALKVFDHPREFHIGHDEVKIPGFSGFGKYPYRPGNLKIGLAHLFVGDVISLHNWLARHGTHTMMWGDMLLNSTEGRSSRSNPTMAAANAPTALMAAAMRNALPKDITICDWRYGAGSEQRNGLQIFQNEGFSAIGSSWYEPRNIKGWARQIIKHHAKGLLQTTWDGYDSNASLLNSGFRQYSAFIDAADAAWSGNVLSDAPSGIAALRQRKDSTASAMFRRLYGPNLLANCSRNGWRANLAALQNVSLNASRSVPWLVSTGSVSTTKLHNLDCGIEVPYNGRAVMLASDFSTSVLPSAPSAVSISVNRRTFALAFLQAVTYAVPDGTPVAEIVVEYANGSHRVVPVRAGFETAALSSALPSQSMYSQRVACTGMGQGLWMRVFTWYNPNPGLVIRKISYSAVSSQTSALLFGVTGVVSK